MARLFQSHQSNLLSIIGKYKSAKNALEALTDGSNIPTLILITSCILTLTFTLDLMDKYTNMNLQRLTRLALKSFLNG